MINLNTSDNGRDNDQGPEHAQDDWIVAYEEHVWRGGPPPTEFPADFLGDDLQELSDARHAIDAMNQVFGQDSSATDNPVAESPPQQLGDFRILREIGRGGMGVVYEAEQISLPRRVAMKVLPFAAVLDPRQLERFKNEARAAATLDHAGIVSIYSVGCERDVHFFAMQFIEGQSLADVIEELQHGGPLERPEANMSATTLSGLTEEFLTENSGLTVPLAEKETTKGTLDDTDKYRTPALSSTGRSDASKDLTHKPTFFRFVARLGAQAAEALDHAHTRGILHRDVKPGNLLLDADGNIHVADFGLARIEAEAGVTMTGDILGTLRYMSPEQALARRAVVDQRTDIYSLGATLYELITRTPLLEGRDRQELLRKIAFEEPKQPRKLNASVPIDLETIILKAIAKNLTDRYATAREMAADLHQFIEGKPVQARRVGATERLWRWSKRNPIVAVLTATVALLATLVAIVTSIGYARTSVALAQVSIERNTAQLERQEAQQERDEAIQNLYVAQMRMAQKDWDDGQIQRLQKTLLSYLPAPGQPDLRGWEWYFHLSRCHSEKMALHGLEGAWVESIVWNSDSTQLAAAGWAGFKLWDVESGETVESLAHHGFDGSLFAWHPGERRLAWQVDDSKTAMVIQQGKSQVTIELSAKLRTVAWSPDGKRLASNGPDKTVIIWDVTTGEKIRELIGLNNEVSNVAWSPDGKRLAASGEVGTIPIWDVETGLLTTTLDSGQYNRCLVWSPESMRLAVGTHGGNTYVWDITSGEKVLASSDRGKVESIAWSPDGLQLATGIQNGLITLRNGSNGKILGMFRQDENVSALAWSPDGKWIASGNRIGIVKIWDVIQDQGVRTIAEDAEHGGIAFSPDDQRLAYWALGQTIKICDVETGDELHALPGPLEDGLEPVWSPDGKHVAVGGDYGSIVLCDLEKDDVRSWQHEGVNYRVSSVDRGISMAWHPDGQQLASISKKESRVRIWDISTGEELSSFEAGSNGRAVAWSPDGKRLATGGSGGTVIWDRVGWRMLYTIETAGGHLGWNHDGRYLASGESGSVTITDTFTGRPSQTLMGHTSHVRIAGWSDDDQRIATCARDGVRMWNPQTGQELLSLPNAKSMAWSHDRKRIATIEDGKVRVYDTSLGYKLATDPSYLSQRALALLHDAHSLSQGGAYERALENVDTAIRLASRDSKTQLDAAWYILVLQGGILALQGERGRDTAMTAACRAVELSPDDYRTWLVLGMAQYRSGRWADARTSLLKAIEIKSGADGYASCYLVMANWQLGEKETARKQYDDAFKKIRRYGIKGENLLGFRDEAAELLGIDIDEANTKKGADKATD